VVSAHRQAVADPGRLRRLAVAPDGVCEAVDDPRRPFYVGVQWHPERGGPGVWSAGLLERFVVACRSAQNAQASA
jgi:gamma-glutamyl-gamma-aminobutyrate hydrolase PuuD